MNRWNYFLIGLRFKSVGQRERYKRPSKLRIAINIIAFIFAIAFLGVIIAYGGIYAVLAGFGFFSFFVGFLYSMSIGKDMIYIQYAIVMEQLRADVPVKFDSRRVKLGFLLSFFPLYLVLIIAVLVPGGGLWFIPWFPLFVTTVILSYMSSGFIEVFNYKMYKYILCHLGAHIFCLATGTLLRIFVTNPILFEAS